MMAEEKIFPKDWKLARLNEISDKISLNKSKLKQQDYLASGKFPVVDQGQELIGGYHNDETMLIPDEPPYIIFGDHTKVKKFITFNFIAGADGVKVLKAKDNVEPKFLFHFLFAIDIEDKGYARHFQLVEKELFPLPSKPTQQAIVSKIEELFGELDKGMENLRIAQGQLKTYRQSVLKWAFEGKLTEKRSEWKNARLGDLANAIDPQPSHRTPPIVQNGVPFVSIKDFDSELDKIDFTHARRVSPSVLQEHLKRYKLEIGDFVIGKIGTIGKPVRIVLPQEYCLSANLVLIQPRKISTTYLYYFFQSNLIEQAFTAGMKATSQPAFGIQKVRELRIELPDEVEQNIIVQEIESRLSVADKIEESITQSMQQAEALRQSILKKAFEGRLV
jgi:type I restriction enzyme S subunit